MDMIRKIRNNDARAAARLMTEIENDGPEAARALQLLYPHTKGAYVVGITGPGGVGKSTLVNGLIPSFLKNDLAIGVIAIDPSSQISGGALLGDRIRMRRHGSDKRVFFRSLATRGGTEGLAKAAVAIMRVLDAMGKDIILVETAGAGQGDVKIANIADTSVLVLMPGVGDEIQMMKAGILEIADVIVINKADVGGAERIKWEIEQMLATKNFSPRSWIPEVILTEAVARKGIEDLKDLILKHKRFIVTSGKYSERSKERVRFEITQIIETAIKKSIQDRLDDERFERMIEEVIDRKSDPYSVALEIVEHFHGWVRE